MVGVALRVNDCSEVEFKVALFASARFSTRLRDGHQWKWRGSQAHQLRPGFQIQVEVLKDDVLNR